MASSTGTRLYGAFMAVLAALGVTGEMVFSKVLLNINWPYWRITACSLLGPLFLVSVVSATHQSKLPERSQLKWIVLKSAFGTVYWCMAIVAVQVGESPGDVAALTSINVIASALMGRMFLSEAVRCVHVLGVALVIGGTICIVQPSFVFGSSDEDAQTSRYGYMFAILSGFIQACYLICSRKSAGCKEWTLCTSAVFSGLFCLALPWTGIVSDASVSVIEESPWEAVGYLLLAFATSWASIQFITQASSVIPAGSCATVYTAAGTTFGYAAQIFIFDVAMTPLTAGGAMLMLCAVVLMAWEKGPQAGVGGDVDVVRVVPMDDASVGSADTSEETRSLASFIASEFSDFNLHGDVMRHRRPAAALIPISPSPVMIGSMAPVVCVAA